MLNSFTQRSLFCFAERNTTNDTTNRGFHQLKSTAETNKNVLKHLAKKHYLKVSKLINNGKIFTSVQCDKCKALFSAYKKFLSHSSPQPMESCIHDNLFFQHQ